MGGIYTVLRTKAAVTAEEFGENYFLMGPYVRRNAVLEVEEQENLACPLTSQVVNRMREGGVRVVCGKWLVEGSPNVLLFDLESVRNRLDEWKADLWEKASIPSPSNDPETDSAILLGYLTAWFFGELAYQSSPESAIVAHFHEWMAGVGAILLKKRRTKVASIFTTHATILGRYLCSGNADFYNNLRNFNEDIEAGKRGIYHRYCLERGAAHCAHVFTTVSHITAYEAEHLLKRKPDGVTPNGINCKRYRTMHELHNLHNENRGKIRSFVQGHFYGRPPLGLEFLPSSSASNSGENRNLLDDSDRTLYFFIAGRYEYRNKGVDLFLEALSRLNQHLRKLNSNINVVAFIIMPAATNNYNVEALKGQAVAKQLNDVVEQITCRIGQRIFEAALRGVVLEAHQMLSETDTVILKRHVLAIKQRNSLPPVVTHNMLDSEHDPIINEIRRLELFNRPEDPVKIVFHPEFLSAQNPVLGMEYDDFVRGCHLGVFPSYYEPWGYTPAECTVMGTPSITTNLSGFGCFIEENVESPPDYGIYIIDRRLKSVEESVCQLANYFIQFCQKTERQRVNLRNRTERLSELLDWQKMGLEYRKARQLALKKAYPELFATSYLPQNVSTSHILDEDDVQIEPTEAFLKFPRPPSVPPPQTPDTEENIVETATIDEFEPFLNMKMHSILTLADAARG